MRPLLPRMVNEAGRVVPDDFTAFVASHGPDIARACAEITGNDQVAQALRDTLLIAVAGRWRRWAVGSRSERALVRIQHLLQREARAQHVDVHPSALDLRSSSRLRTAPFGGNGDEHPEPSARNHRDGAAVHLATAAWLRAARSRRTRWTGVGVAALAVLAVLLVLPPAPAPEPPLPTEVPERVTVLPAFNELMQGLTGWAYPLPPYLLLGSSDVDALPALGDAPLARATLVAQASRGVLVVVGENPRDEFAGTDPWDRRPLSEPPQRRRFEHPMLQGARLVATSLSPDGTTLALPKDDDLVLVDVRTGGVRTVEVGGVPLAAPQAPVTWLDPTRVMMAGFGTRVVNVVTNDVAPVDLDAVDVLSLRGYGSPRLARLVAVPPDPDTAEDPHTIRSLLMFWRDLDAAGNAEPVAGVGQVGIRHIVTGPPWLSSWVGPGFASPALVVRACDPTMLRLPREVGTASAAVSAIDGNGNELGTLVATGGTRLDVLGLLRQDTHLALVAMRVDGRSLIVAWNPHDGSLAAATHLNADAQVSVADLLALCATC